MPHCVAQATQLTCPQCQAQFSSDLWLIVDCAERPDLVDLLRAGDLHKLTCPNCGSSGAADAAVLVYMPADYLTSNNAASALAPLLVFSPAQATSRE